MYRRFDKPVFQDLNVSAKLAGGILSSTTAIYFMFMSILGSLSLWQIGGILVVALLTVALIYHMARFYYDFQVYAIQCMIMTGIMLYIMVSHHIGWAGIGPNQVLSALAGFVAVVCVFLYLLPAIARLIARFPPFRRF